jgi:hypothetical protein
MKKILVLALCLCVSVLQAQIKGELKDKETKENILFANVGLLKTSDSTFVKGAISNEKGVFVIRGVKDGDYILRISYIGYKPFEKPITYKDKLDLGTILLEKSVEILDGVEIVSQRPLYSMDGDKTVYSVEDDPSIQTGTTTDALQNAPGVQVDAEGNIKLQGVECVEIWLNDKPSKIKEDGLKTFLENLPANALQKIEVMTNPPAKYANTSGCGVINIVTNAKIKKNHFISFGSGINTLGNITPHLSYVWANEKLNIGFYSSFNIRNNSYVNDSYATAFIDNSEGGKDTLYHEVTHSETDSKNFGGWLSLNVDYEIDSTSSFGFWSGLGPNYYDSKSISQRERSDYKEGEIINTYYREEGQNKTYGTWGYLSANYDKRFDDKGHRMNLSLDGNFDTGKGLDRAVRVYSEQNPLFGNLNKEYESSSGSYRFSLDGRYSRPFENGGELGCGMGLSVDNDYNIKDVMAFDSINEVYSLVDSLRSHNKHSNNYEMTAYLDWRQKLGDFTFTLGLNTDVEYRDFIAKNTYFADDTTMFFFTLRPNIRLSYRTKSMHDISASYSFSSSTPSTNSLSTFRDYEEESYSVGNRNLENEYTHRVGLRWSKFFKQAGYVSASFSSSWSNNSISSVTDMVYDDYLDRYISFSMPYNLGSSSSQSLMLMGNLRLGAFANLNIYTTLSHNMYAMDYIDGNHYEQENTSLRGNVSLWSRFSEQFQIFIGTYASTPTKSIFSKSDYYYNLNFGTTANFFDKRLTLSLRVEDPFNWNKSENSNFAPYLHTYSTRKYDSRFISFSITLKFGKLELENHQAPAEGGGGGGM